MKPALLLFLVACTGEPEPGKNPGSTPADTAADEADADTDTDTDADTDTDVDTGPPPVAGIDSRIHPRDYGYAFWPANHWEPWGTFHDVQHIQTGWYGLAIDWGAGSIDHLGGFAGAPGAADAAMQGNEVITDLPAAAVSYSVTRGESTWTASRFLGRDGSATNPSELVDMGAVMQRIDIPTVGYDGAPDVQGGLSLAAGPRHFVLTHSASSPGGVTARITLSGAAVADLTQVRWLETDRAVQYHDGAGTGWTFIVPTGGRISHDGSGSIVFEGEDSVSVLAIPLAAADDDQLDVWLDPSAVAIEAAQLNRDGTAAEDPVPATYDPVRGVWVVSLRDITTVGGPTPRDFDDAANHTFYNRHSLVVTNGTGSPVSVPLAFDGGGRVACYITGGSALLRDENGEPTGIPVQHSKNWHDGEWVHLYAMPLLPTGETTLEHTFAHSRWGETYAVQHSQLSLVGWGQNQQWDESSIGVFGESITYDPDLTLGRAMVDDVRPFLVDAGTKWWWTGNVGGASFLVYDPADAAESRPDRPLERLRTHYAETGPNLTDVRYTGVTHDGRIEAEIRTQLGRTDDLVRVWYQVTYTVLEDTTYDRFALFQVASDRYADNGFQKYAYGDATGVLVDASVTDHRTTGYASASDRGIALSGPAPWVSLYDNALTNGSPAEQYANVGFVVRDYRVDIGGTVTTTPHLNLQRTYNGGWSQVGFELGLPTDLTDKTLPAGSVLEATVEYLVPPADASRYYGESDHLAALTGETFQSAEMMRHLAAGNAVEVEATVGVVTRSMPVEIEGDVFETAADFTLTGGLGYVPVTITGLARPDGWTLEQQVEGAWVAVDQSVEGNDWWQAADHGDGTFSLTFNLPNRGTERYRLVR